MQTEHSSKSKQKLFFSGLGGSGVSAIAGFMADLGHTVVGSDRAFDHNPNHPFIAPLLAKGIRIVHQDGLGLDSSFDIAIFSTAVEHDTPEYVKAVSLGLRIMTRPEHLAGLVRVFKTVAVSGTSGKSTVSGMLAFAMHALGLHPNFIGGGRVRQFHGGHNAGNALAGDSDTLVIEACESDGSIVLYQPEHSIVLNLDLDHHNIEETSRMFKTLLDNTSGMKIMNFDDAYLRAITPADAVGFSIDAPSEYRAEDIRLKPFGSEFSVRGTSYAIALPGIYNVSNALACIAFLCEAGVTPARIAHALAEFRGIERRFDIHLDGARFVIDDYAHNPHKIASLMGAVMAIKPRVRYIFQPHGYAPTRLMREGYVETFGTLLRHEDHLCLLPIFYAGGTTSKDISSEALAEDIGRRGKSATVCTREDIIATAGQWDAHVVMGARDETLSDFARAIADKARLNLREDA